MIPVVVTSPEDDHSAMNPPPSEKKSSPGRFIHNVQPIVSIGSPQSPRQPAYKRSGSGSLSPEPQGTPPQFPSFEDKPRFSLLYYFRRAQRNASKPVIRSQSAPRQYVFTSPRPLGLRFEGVQKDDKQQSNGSSSPSNVSSTSSSMPTGNLKLFQTANLGFETLEQLDPLEEQIIQALAQPHSAMEPPYRSSLANEVQQNMVLTARKLQNDPESAAAAAAAAVQELISASQPGNVSSLAVDVRSVLDLNTTPVPTSVAAPEVTDQLCLSCGQMLPSEAILQCNLPTCRRRICRSCLRASTFKSLPLMKNVKTNFDSPLCLDLAVLAPHMDGFVCAICDFQSRKRPRLNRSEWHWTFNDQSDLEFARALRDSLPSIPGLFLEIHAVRQACWRRRRGNSRKHYSFKQYGGFFEGRIQAAQAIVPAAPEDALTSESLNSPNALQDTKHEEAVAPASKLYNRTKRPQDDGFEKAQKSRSYSFVEFLDNRSSALSDEFSPQNTTLETQSPRSVSRSEHEPFDGKVATKVADRRKRRSAADVAPIRTVGMTTRQQSRKRAYLASDNSNAEDQGGELSGEPRPSRSRSRARKRRVPQAGLPESFPSMNSHTMEIQPHLINDIAAEQI